MSRWSILSLTDLHYESPDWNYVDDAKELGNLPQFRDSLFREFEAVLSGLGGLPFDAVTFGGDITTQGKPAGFERFRREMLPKLLDLAPTPSHLCVVPGNHDVEWMLDPAAEGSFDRKFRMFGDTLSGYEVTTCLMPTGHMAGDGSGYRFMRPPRGPVFVDEKRKLIVVLLNSAVRCGELNARLHKDIGDAARAVADALAPEARAQATAAFNTLLESIKRHSIRDVAHVTQMQRSQIQEELAKLKTDLGTEWRTYLRVGLLHHHLVPFSRQQTEQRGYESVLDAAQVLRLFGEYDFDLVLTGHKHQPYEEIHKKPDYEFLLVGGPTVGGYATDFRGLRVLDIEDRDDYREISVADIPYEFGAADAASRIAERRAEAARKPWVIARRVRSLAHRTQLVGYSYREIASITNIDPDGDARRIVECEDLLIVDPRAARARGHLVELPMTSGYLSTFSAKGRGFGISHEPIDEHPRQQKWSGMLAFDQEVGVGGRAASYRYEWRAVNSYARNEEEFALRYRGPHVAPNVEFTHFVVNDPVAELTVVVGFPPEFKPKSPPTVRVARHHPANPPATQWEIDATLKAALTESHALRFYESLNVAAVRVSNPVPGVYYGINWELPAPAWPPGDDGMINAFRAGFHEGTFAKKGPGIIFRGLAELLLGVRLSMLEDWNGQLDISLILFDARVRKPLFVVSAVSQQIKKMKPKRQFTNDEVTYRGGFEYGDGIAGRAFKSNQPRAYVAPSGKPDGPDYYTVLPGVDPPHQVLLSLPIHMPLPDKEFKATVKAKDSTRAYGAVRPYGVISFGSTRADCPLARFSRRDYISELNHLQHDVNKAIFKTIKKVTESG